MATTITTVTRKQIRILAAEASEHGDEEMTAAANWALTGWAEREEDQDVADALAKCVSAIRSAEAMQ